VACTHTVRREKGTGSRGGGDEGPRCDWNYHACIAYVDCMFKGVCMFMYACVAMCVCGYGGAVIVIVRTRILYDGGGYGGAMMVIVRT
jgi:hypothetical protein